MPTEGVELPPEGRDPVLDGLGFHGPDWAREGSSSRRYMSTDDMSTEDVLAFFKQHTPQSVEWIDDSRCNVVWDGESDQAALALLSHSVPFDASDDDAEERMDTTETTKRSKFNFKMC